MLSKSSSPFIVLTRPFPKLLLGTVTLTVIASLMEGATLALAIPLLQRLVTGSVENGTSESASYIQNILAFFDRFEPKHQLPAIASCLLMMTAVKGTFRFLADFSLRTLMIKVGLHLRTVCVGRFLKLGLSYYSKTQGGNLLSYVNEQTQRCEQLTLHVGSLFSEVLTILSFLLLLVSISWQLTLIALILVTLTALSLKSIVTTVKSQGRIVSSSIDQFSSAVFELIGGIRVVKTCTAEYQESSKIQTILQKRYQAERIASAGHAAVHPISDMCGMSVIMLLIFLGTGVLATEMVLPLLLTFLLVLVRIFPRINRLNRVRTTVANFGESLQVIQNFLDETEIPDIKNGGQDFKGVHHQIHYKSVDFSYSDDSQLVLKNVNLVIPKGKVTAFVGESGSGKSTLADLLLRLYDPQKGQITIDGQDLRRYRLESLRRYIAVVSQETFLFNDSVLENIRYGNPQLTESEVISAARKACADEFIRQLPQGYNTCLGDRGVRLSGGQRQRLAIARAIVRDPEILILDEATSALDSSSEKLVQQALETVSKNRTVIVIAHRLSTIRQADQIIVMKQGEILEQGTHEELMLKAGYYHRLNLDQSMSLAM